MIQNQDIVTLFSNAQPKLFPTNTAYRFTNRLPHLWKIPQSESWRVGVSEFSTLNTLDTIPMDLTINVDIDNDPRFNGPRHVDRFQFFMSGGNIKTALTAKDFEDRITAMQHYNQNIPPEYRNCNIPWNPFINGLAGVTQQMLSQTGFNTYLLFHKVGGDIKVGVKHNDTTLSNTRFVLSPALQHLLLLDDPTGIQTLKSFDTLGNRHVYSQNGKHCDFWYRIIPDEQVVVHWPGFHHSVGKDPFNVLEALANKYEFFTFEKHVDTDNKTETVKLKFKETNDVVMVEFPDDFLKLSDKHTSVTFKLELSTPNYSITDKNKTPMKEAYPLGSHLKEGSTSTTTPFFLTDGSEIQLSRKVSINPPSEYWLKNFKLTTYYAKQPLTQTPYHQTLRIPRGNYSMKSFINTMKTSFGNQPTFLFTVKETNGVVKQVTTVQKEEADEQTTGAEGKRKKGRRGGGGEKRTRLMDSMQYKCTLKSTIPGYRITIDPRLQSILAFERNIQRGYDVQTSTRPILLSSFTYNLMLYCKFIKPNIQGGQYEPVLRTIPFPTQKQRGESIMMEFERIQFHQLDVTALEDLSIEIRDDTGEVVQFNDGRTMLKLMFIRHPS